MRLLGHEARSPSLYDRHVALYDEIGHGYATVRVEDPRLARPIWDALGDARTVVNVGAGAGSYEPRDREVVAVEPSAVMIAQRPARAAPAVLAAPERLPFPDDSFDAAMAIITLHHWDDVDAGLREMRRVARRRTVIVTFDPALEADLWIARDYIREHVIHTFSSLPPISRILERFPDAEVRPLLIPNDCSDRMFATLWGPARGVPRPAHPRSHVRLAAPPCRRPHASNRRPAPRPRLRRLGQALRPPPHNPRVRRRTTPDHIRGLGALLLLSPTTRMVERGKWAELVSAQTMPSSMPSRSASREQ
jgi:SAM-dependent methyltransferase